MIKYATLCYLTSEGKTLMIKKRERENDPNSSLYVAPGGGIKTDEFTIQSARREFKEETGLKIYKPRLIGTALYDNRDRTFPNFNPENNFYVYVFKASKYSGKLETETEEGFPKWIENKTMPRINPRECDSILWKLVNNGYDFTAHFKHNGEVLDRNESTILLF